MDTDDFEIQFLPNDEKTRGPLNNKSRLSMLIPEDMDQDESDEITQEDIFFINKFIDDISCLQNNIKEFIEAGQKIQKDFFQDIKANYFKYINFSHFKENGFQSDVICDAFRNLFLVTPSLPMLSQFYSINFLYKVAPVAKFNLNDKYRNQYKYNLLQLYNENRKSIEYRLEIFKLINKLALISFENADLLFEGFFQIIAYFIEYDLHKLVDCPTIYGNAIVVISKCFNTFVKQMAPDCRFIPEHQDIEYHYPIEKVLQNAFRLIVQVDSNNPNISKKEIGKVKCLLAELLSILIKVNVPGTSDIILESHLFYSILTLAQADSVQTIKYSLSLIKNIYKNVIKKKVLPDNDLYPDVFVKAFTCSDETVDENTKIFLKFKAAKCLISMLFFNHEYDDSVGYTTPIYLMNNIQPDLITILLKDIEKQPYQVTKLYCQIINMYIQTPEAKLVFDINNFLEKAFILIQKNDPFIIRYMCSSISEIIRIASMDINENYFYIVSNLLQNHFIEVISEAINEIEYDEDEYGRQLRKHVETQAGILIDFLKDFEEKDNQN